jgi:hypothetical protein
VENFGKGLVLVSVINMDCLQSCIVAFQHTVSRNHKGHFVICIKVAVPVGFCCVEMVFAIILYLQLRLQTSLTLSCFYNAIHNFYLGVLNSSVLTFHSHKTDM